MNGLESVQGRNRSACVWWPRDPGASWRCENQHSPIHASAAVAGTGRSTAGVPVREESNRERGRESARVTDGGAAGSFRADSSSVSRAESVADCLVRTLRARWNGITRAAGGARPSPAGAARGQGGDRDGGEMRGDRVAFSQNHGHGRGNQQVHDRPGDIGVCRMQRCRWPWGFTGSRGS